MNKFNRRAFERKGSSKELQKEENFLMRNLHELKEISLGRNRFNLKELVKEVLT